MAKSKVSKGTSGQMNWKSCVKKQMSAGKGLKGALLGCKGMEKKTGKVKKGKSK